MSAAHVMIVAYDFPPHGAVGTQRTLRLVRHLASTGWRVTVVTADPSHYLPGTPTDAGLLERVPPSVTVVRTPVLRGVTRAMSRLRPKRPAATSAPAMAAAGPAKAAEPSSMAGGQSVLRRMAAHVDAVTSIPDAEAGWYWPAVREGLVAARVSKPDVVFSSAPPWTGHLAGARLARRLGVPFVADFRDPWARAPWRAARQTPLQRQAASWLERRVVESAAHIVFATRAARARVVEAYGASLAGTTHVVPNGCDRSMFEGRAPIAAGDGRFVFLHAGSLYGGRNPASLLRAAASAIAAGRIPRDRVRLRFLGTVSLPGVDLARLPGELGLEGVVEFPGRVPQGQSLGEMLGASALVLLQPGTTMSVPAKAYEYLAAGRPILALTPEGETADLVRESGTGLVASPGDERAIEDALVAIVEHPERFAGPCPVELYDGAVRAAEMADVLRLAIGGAPLRDAVRPAGPDAAPRERG